MVFIKHMEILGGEAAIVEVEGALNSQTSPDFEDYINQLVEKNIFYILFDASRLEYVSSDGIGLALFIQKKLSQNNGFLVIYSLPDEVYSLFKLLGFDKIFTLAGSRIDAMQIMDRQIEMRGAPVGEAGTLTIEKDALPAAAPDRIPEMPEENYPIPEAAGGVSGSAALMPEKKGKEEFDPVIVECMNCKSLIRVKKSGDYICPSCKIEFTVDAGRTVHFQ